jgi:glycosyltransferase involved in cell wall biosynthesis
MKLVSIIMPAYNCEQYVGKAIDSILNQTYPHFELLIADDCSKDNTKAMIDSYSDPRIKRFHNLENQGYTKASNLLYKQVNGEYVTFQDADDYSDEKRLETLTHLLEQNPEYGCVGSNISKVDENNHVFFTSQFPLTHDTIEPMFAQTKIVMTGSALMARRSAIIDFGLYHTYFDRLGSEDVYWFSRILSENKVMNVSDVLYYYRAHPNSVTSFFKAPKTYVLHNLVVHLYNRRKRGQTDYLLSNDIARADATCQYFILLDQAVKSKIKSVFKYIGMFFVWPSLGSIFFRDFLYKWMRT